MKKSTKKKITSSILAVITVLALILLDKLGYIDINDYIESNNGNTEQNAYVDLSDDNLYDVVRVVDGDTIVVNYNGTNEKVRLIGVDTPESVHVDKSKNTEEGVKVSDYTKSQLTGKKVALELDVQERDKYGRILAYVYLDGVMYNKTLLEIGYAKVATYPPNVKYVDEFTKIQEKARENKVGLWQE